MADDGVSRTAVISKSSDENGPISKQHQNVADQKAIASLKEKIPDIDNIFDVHGRVGNGTFSTVLLATYKKDRGIKERQKKYAIKHLVPTSHPSRIEKELKCLLYIGGVDNVVGVDLCLRRHESVAFVMPYLQHDHFQHYYDKLNVVEVKNYIKNLLIALRRVHGFNVIHRDVKPSNFLHNRKAGKYMLVDFGLAQYIICHDDRSRNGLKRKADCDIDDEQCCNAKKFKYNGNSATTSNLSTHTVKLNSNEISNDCEKVKFSENLKTIALATTRITTASPAITSFKMPLKQVNEIVNSKSESKSSIGSSRDTDASVSRQYKNILLSTNSMQNLKARSKMGTNSPHKKSDTGYVSASNSKKYNTTNASASNATCSCYGKNNVCTICLIKRDIPAARAGTPGYRPPEVLLKHPDQTTAVDMWAVGVIFISILSRTYPFFRAPDDFVALAEIMTLFGDAAIRRTASALNRMVCISRKCEPLHLRRLCVRLQNRFKINHKQLIAQNSLSGKYEKCTNCQQYIYDCLCANSGFKIIPLENDLFPESAYDLLGKLLQINPYERITAEEALRHPFLSTNF